MRAAPRALLALALALPAGTAWAQVQQNDPNAANASFALQSQIRTLNQQRVTDYNTLNQSIQRNVQFESFGPVVPYRGVYGGRPSGYIVGHPVGRQRGAHGLVRRGGGLNTSVCTGC
ncbi:hypothetical protein MKK75_10655 [Methylobacterium sp. J-030]|uniref:hypothetical protein n=1 Tax=Methylobacterium sp. J-030 TaxID=2836627 RepID=UPI001FBB9608|nr:hypothetical protein [Methylobacterium sp. J-030]MCJ2069254.1 hypothetical protein [Methylobacterium sp. J-030]